MSTRQLMVAIVALGLLGACLGPDGRSMPSNGLVITTASSGSSDVLYAFDPGTGKVDAWPPLGGVVYGGVLSADSKMLFLNIRDSGFRSDLVAIDARSGSALWSLSLGTAGQPRILDGVGLLTGEVMAAAGDDSLLYLWRSIKDSVVGIAALNLKTQRPVAFSGPWNVAAGGIQPTTQRCNAPRAVLMVVAGRGNTSGGPRRDEAVYTLDAQTLAPLDSISLPELGASPAEDVWQALPSADGRTLYVATSTRIVSGEFERGMVVTHAQTGKPFATKYAQAVFGRDRSTVDTAYPGDVVGLVNAMALAPGDTLYSGPKVQFPPIPSFAPEHFSVCRAESAGKYKQFRKAIDQLDSEGVVQVLRNEIRGDASPVLAAVGPMQFEVVTARMKTEFGVETSFQGLPYQLARRTDAESVDELNRQRGVEVFTRSDGALLALVSDKWRLQYIEKEHGDLTLEPLVAAAD